MQQKQLTVRNTVVIDNKKAQSNLQLKIRYVHSIIGLLEIFVTAKHKELKQIGSFYCLNGKVDLSTFEAINTLDEWETKYNK